MPYVSMLAFAATLAEAAKNTYFVEVLKNLLKVTNRQYKEHQQHNYQLNELTNVTIITSRKKAINTTKFQADI